MKKKTLLLCLLPLLALCSCGGNNKDPQPTPGPDPDPIPTPEPGPDPKPEPEPEPKPTIFDNKAPGKNKSYSKLEKFTPTKFKAETFKEDNKKALGDGVNHIEYSFKLNNDNKVIADVLEVDLTKAELTTNYSATGVSTINNQMKDFEAKTNKKVMGIVNADFFATGVGTSVNAYVKENEIIKAGHNDNGKYDYTDLSADIPASKPMLLGISGETAKISPIINKGTIEETIKSTFKNFIVYLNSKNEEVEIKDQIAFNVTSLSSKVNYAIITKNLTAELAKDTQIIKVKKKTNNSVITHGDIIEIKAQKLDGTKVFKDTGEYFYVVTNPEFNLDVTKESKIGYSINTSDETWKYYEDVIGGRQSLVENGKIASTVTKENSNGAQNTNIPRTCVGVKDDHTVLICSIESLRYNKKLTVKPEDGYGVNLPELAEFMRYIGAFDAMNFDGGGSTQMITKDKNGQGEAKVEVRSSDYGTTELNAGRKVYNTLIVASK